MIMKEIYNEFIKYFYEEDKEKTVLFILDKLAKKEIDIIDLYTMVLTPALNNLTCELADKRICIWKEHIKTAIVRTIVESAYPFVIEKERQLRETRNEYRKGSAVVICPPEEYHDLGARMSADFLTMNGFDTIYVGSNTPYEDFYNAVEVINPDVIAISVSNYYNIVATKRIIQDLKEVKKIKAKIVVGGQAFNHDTSNFEKVKADYYARTFDDIKKIAEEVLS